MAVDCAALLAQLNEAKAALHALSIGGVVRSITDSDGSRIEYSQANKVNLVSYVALLQAQYDACIGSTAPVLTKPVNYFF
jgi:hypothetical protein